MQPHGRSLALVLALHDVVYVLPLRQDEFQVFPVAGVSGL